MTVQPQFKEGVAGVQKKSSSLSITAGGNVTGPVHGVANSQLKKSSNWLSLMT